MYTWMVANLISSERSIREWRKQFPFKFYIFSGSVEIAASRIFSAHDAFTTITARYGHFTNLISLYEVKKIIVSKHGKCVLLKLLSVKVHRPVVPTWIRPSLIDDWLRAPVWIHSKIEIFLFLFQRKSLCSDMTICFSRFSSGSQAYLREG